MRSSAFRVLALLPALVFGCAPAAVEPITPPLVPVKGKVTLDGKPLPGATIGFLPATGSAGAGDVKEDGTYSVTYLGFKGLPSGQYTVQISYKMGSNGKPQSLGQQFSLRQPSSMFGAKELLPKKYSDFGVSELRAKVPLAGGSFDFDLTGPLDEPPPIAKEFLKAEGKDDAKAEDIAPAKDTAPAAPASKDTVPEPKSKPESKEKAAPKS
jgi:hypothetical protein